MPRPLVHGAELHIVGVPAPPRRSYLVLRRQDVWFIDFEGEEFGPYQSEREALLFAVDAAHQFGEQGEDTQVLRVDENGVATPVWTHGIDHYPL